jgi:hypothetical protein
MVGAFAMAATKCHSVDAVDTEIVQVSGNIAADEKGRLLNHVQERWVVRLCEQRIPYRVDFEPDGRGGTYFKAAMEK